MGAAHIAIEHLPLELLLPGDHVYAVFGARLATGNTHVQTFMRALIVVQPCIPTCGRLLSLLSFLMFNGHLGSHKFMFSLGGQIRGAGIVSRTLTALLGRSAECLS